MNKFQTLLALFLISSGLTAFSAQVDTVNLYSQVNKKLIKAAVVMPDSYTIKKSKQRFTVLYLLHGFSDPFSAWLNNSTPDKDMLKGLVDKYNLIVVLPDGGFASWYLDSPLEKQSQYETYIIKELIPYIDKTYRTKAFRKGRFITGLSMGGHGSLYLSGRHPELFLAAGSISGALDLSRDLDNVTIQQWFSKILGPASENEDRYRENSVFFMTDKLKASGLKLTIDVGTGDFLFNVNKDFHQKLLSEGIEHDYAERPGAHDWKYFSNSLEYHLLFFLKAQRSATDIKP
jgi:S-formylglutathione hydrolase FrmB